MFQTSGCLNQIRPECTPHNTPLHTSDLGSHIFWSSAKICQTMSNQINMPTILGYLMLSVLSNHPSLFFGVSGPVWPFQRPPFHLPSFSPSRNFEIFGRHRSFEINVWLVDGGGFHPRIIRWSWPTRSKRPRCPIHAVEIPRNSPWLWNGKIMEVGGKFGWKNPKNIWRHLSHGFSTWGWTLFTGLAACPLLRGSEFQGLCRTIRGEGVWFRW